jgi:hypothetical protein
VRASRGLAAQLVFLSPLAFAGGLAIFFSQIFAWVFLPMVDLRGLWEWRGPVERARGAVVAIEPTSTRVNRRTVMEVAFDHGGRRGASYATDTRGLAPGDPVELEHPAGKPERARVVGMQRSAFPAWAVLPTLPPVIAGVVLLAIGIVVGLRRVRVVRRGELTRGELVDRVPTNTRVNQRRVHKHRYRFTAIDGRAGETTCRSHHDLPDLTDVVYDPETLGAVVLPALPGRPTLDPVGPALVATRPRLTLLLAALPVLGVMGWAGAVLFAMSR